jgi:ATP-dependent DNA ligase
VFLFAFDLLELNGDDLRREPIELRKPELAKLLRNAQLGLQLNEHIAEPGDVVFHHACRLGLEGIVSKRLGSRYRSGRSPDWLKMKNPAAPRCGARLMQVLFGREGCRAHNAVLLSVEEIRHQSVLGPGGPSRPGAVDP